MIFYTVGTLFAFDRMTRTLDEAIGAGAIDQSVFGQIGRGKYQPVNMEWVEVLDKEAFEQKISQADALLSHAGMGSIETAIRYSKPLLVMPRMKKYGEHVNDHQVGTARKFAELGHILTAMDETELSEKIRLLKNFVPSPRKNQADLVAARIRRFLKKC